jgi:metal-responsive CopG/Arc/MetJ family transcriptional regulator
VTDCVGRQGTQRIFVGIKLSKQTVLAIDEISADEDKSRSDIVRMLIRKGIEKLEEEQRDLF